MAADSVDTTGTSGLTTEFVEQMKTIELTKGYVAIVDDEDYELLSTRSWQALVAPSGVRPVAGATKGRGKTILMYRLILGAAPGQVVDHINGDTLDNRRANLRIATTAQNAANMHRSKNQLRGLFKGITKVANQQRWTASLSVDCKRRFIGWYDTPEEAALAYDKAARAQYGVFANCNLPEGASLADARASASGTAMARQVAFADVARWLAELGHAAASDAVLSQVNSVGAPGDGSGVSLVPNLRLRSGASK